MSNPALSSARMICRHSWDDESPDTHVCKRGIRHLGQHYCQCGALLGAASSTSVPTPLEAQRDHRAPAPAPTDLEGD